jgi:acetyltransferase-like isoleucine patch superfamily enzyme
VSENAVCSIGKGSSFNVYGVFACREKLIIGEHVLVGPFVSIHDLDYNYKTNDL